MTNPDLLSPWVRRFLLEYLVGERNFARNTQKSYRDALQQFLPFIARIARRRIDGLRVDDISPANIRAFLQDLERNLLMQVTGNGVQRCMMTLLTQ